MAKLNLQKLVSDFNDALGWPYVSPGSNNEQGIDCSGMFVRAYKLQGASIYHGSNTIYRKYLTENRGKITNSKNLKVGMAVFKNRAWTENDKSNKWYGDSFGNMYHIGLVVSVNPVRIIHASTNGMRVRKDAYSSAWNYYGELKDVNYQEKEVVPVGQMYVVSSNGLPVNLRSKASTTTGQILKKVPSGTQVTVNELGDQWSNITYDGADGFMQSIFLLNSVPSTPNTELKKKIISAWTELGKLIEQL